MSFLDDLIQFHSFVCGFVYCLCRIYLHEENVPVLHKDWNISGICCIFSEMLSNFIVLVLYGQVTGRKTIILRSHIIF